MCELVEEDISTAVVHIYDQVQYSVVQSSRLFIFASNIQSGWSCHSISKYFSLVSGIRAPAAYKTRNLSANA